MDITGLFNAFLRYIRYSIEYSSFVILLRIIFQEAFVFTFYYFYFPDTWTEFSITVFTTVYCFIVFEFLIYNITKLISKQRKIEPDFDVTNLIVWSKRSKFKISIWNIIPCYEMHTGGRFSHLKCKEKRYPLIKQLLLSLRRHSSCSIKSSGKWESYFECKALSSILFVIIMEKRTFIFFLRNPKYYESAFFRSD